MALPGFPVLATMTGLTKPQGIALLAARCKERAKAS